MSSEPFLRELRRPDVKPLPTKASGLLRLAVHDARKLCRDPRFTLDLTHWIVASERHCVACLAGATLLRSTEVEDVAPYYYGYLGPEVAYRDTMTLIDALRRADWNSIVVLLPPESSRHAAKLNVIQCSRIVEALLKVRDAESVRISWPELRKDSDPEVHQAYNLWFAALLHFARVLRKNGL